MILTNLNRLNISPVIPPRTLWITVEENNMASVNNQFSDETLAWEKQGFTRLSYIKKTAIYGNLYYGLLIHLLEAHNKGGLGVHESTWPFRVSLLYHFSRWKGINILDRNLTILPNYEIELIFKTNTFLGSPSPSVSRSTRFVPSLFGWGLTQIHMPFVLGSIVDPRAKPTRLNEIIQDDRGLKRKASASQEDK